MAKVQTKAKTKAAVKPVNSTKKVNVAVAEETQGGVSIALNDAEIALATKIASEIAGGSAGVNGSVPIVRKPEIFEFVKTRAKEMFEELTNRQIREVVELTAKAFVAFPQVGAQIAWVGLGNFKVIRRAERNTSKFGAAKVVPETNYFIFEPGKIAKEAALHASNAIPHGNLRKKLGLKKAAPVAAAATGEKIEL
jgi:nucleoid DNA-binding protein